MGMASSSAIASRPASGPPAVVNMGGEVVNHAQAVGVLRLRP
jgi:hypothetical protein